MEVASTVFDCGSALTPDSDRVNVNTVNGIRIVAQTTSGFAPSDVHNSSVNEKCPFFICITGYGKAHRLEFSLSALSRIRLKYTQLVKMTLCFKVSCLKTL